MLVILLAGLALLGYFLHKDRQGLLTDPYKIIAPDAFVVIETADIQSLFNSLTTGKGIFSELGKTEEFRSFDTKLKYIADQLNKPGLKKLVLEGKTLVSFHPAGQKKPVQPSDVQTFIRQACSEKNLCVTCIHLSDSGLAMLF